MADYMENVLLNWLFRTQATFTKPSVVAVALLSTNAGETDGGDFAVTGVEIGTGLGYSRQTLNPLDANWTDPTAGTQGETDNASEITFGAATSNYDNQPTTAFAILDNAGATLGNLWFYSALDANKTVDSGDTPSFAIGALNVQLG